MIPYGSQWIEDEDIKAVVEVLSSAWLTTGPSVSAFESALAEQVGTSAAVAVSSGTAALHAAMYALNIGAGDEVIVPSMTFAATANCVVYQGGIPVFSDVQANTLLLDPEKIEALISPRTKAVIAVDYAGQCSDYDALRRVVDRHGLALVADACHSLGGRYKNRPSGSLANLTAFSFHPVKLITTGEGGAVTTNDSRFAEKMRMFRNHGMSTDHRQRELQGSWFYEMVDLGYNYRITDIQCALGISQLKRLGAWGGRRQEIALQYDEAFASNPLLRPLGKLPEVHHAYHLYVIRVTVSNPARVRETLYLELRNRGIGANVHYIPVHLHPFFRTRFGTYVGMCPIAEDAYERILSLPLYPRMSDSDVRQVIEAVNQATSTILHRFEELQ